LSVQRHRRVRAQELFTAPCVPLGHRAGQAKAKLGQAVGRAWIQHSDIRFVFLFFENIQILANSKICVEFI
jgi:hypothetical protein